MEMIDISIRYADKENTRKIERVNGAGLRVMPGKMVQGR